LFFCDLTAIHEVAIVAAFRKSGIRLSSFSGGGRTSILHIYLDAFGKNA